MRDKSTPTALLVRKHVNNFGSSGWVNPVSHLVAQRLIGLTTSESRHRYASAMSAKRSAGGGSPHRARCGIRLWRTRGNDRCGLRFSRRTWSAAGGVSARADRVVHGRCHQSPGRHARRGSSYPWIRRRRVPPPGCSPATPSKDPVVALCGAVGREDRPKRTHLIYRHRRGDEDCHQVHRRDHRPGQYAGGGGERVLGRHHDAARRGVVAILPREVLDAPTPARCCWTRSGLAHVQ
jgi:hypothetical protein